MECEANRFGEPSDSRKAREQDVLEAEERRVPGVHADAAIAVGGPERLDPGANLPDGLRPADGFKAITDPLEGRVEAIGVVVKSLQSRPLDAGKATGDRMVPIGPDLDDAVAPLDLGLEPAMCLADPAIGLDHARVHGATTNDDRSSVAEGALPDSRSAAPADRPATGASILGAACVVSPRPESSR